MNNIKILGLDVSTNNCSVALLYNEQIEEISSGSNTIRAQKLLSMINELLIKTKIKESELTALAFGAGPGSFTGLKIASSVIQGLSLAWNKPIIKVSTLWALALQAFEQLNVQDSYNDKYIMPCIDAKMGQVYYGVYSAAFQNHLLPKPIQEDSLAKPEQIKISNKDILVVGDGAYIVQQKMFLDPDQKLTIEPTIQHIKAECIVRLAEYYYKENDAIIINNADPIYLKLYD